MLKWPMYFCAVQRIIRSPNWLVERDRLLLVTPAAVWLTSFTKSHVAFREHEDMVFMSLIFVLWTQLTASVMMTRMWGVGWIGCPEKRASEKKSPFRSYQRAINLRVNNVSLIILISYTSQNFCACYWIKVVAIVFAVFIIITIFDEVMFFFFSFSWSYFERHRFWLAFGTLPNKIPAGRQVSWQRVWQFFLSPSSKCPGISLN